MELYIKSLDQLLQDHFLKNEQIFIISIGNIEQTIHEIFNLQEHCISLKLMNWMTKANIFRLNTTTELLELLELIEKGKYHINADKLIIWNFLNDIADIGHQWYNQTINEQIEINFSINWLSKIFNQIIRTGNHVEIELIESLELENKWIFLPLPLFHKENNLSEKIGNTKLGTGYQYLIPLYSKLLQRTLEFSENPELLINSNDDEPLELSTQFHNNLENEDLEKLLFKIRDDTDLRFYQDNLKKGLNVKYTYLDTFVGRWFKFGS